MPAYRYFIDDDLVPGLSVAFENQEMQHLTRVMRRREGDAIELINGRGALARAQIVRIEKHQAIVSVVHCERQEPLAAPLILAQAICKPNHLSFILEKGTELGVMHFWLFPSAHSEKESFPEHQLQRLRAVTIAAIKQCGRLYLPDITLKGPLSQWQGPWDYPAFYGSLREGARPLAHAIAGPQPFKGALFFVGPEQGFSSAEQDLLDRQGVEGVRLHPHILRTETAGLAAMTLLSHIFYYS